MAKPYKLCEVDTLAKGLDSAKKVVKTLGLDQYVKITAPSKDQLKMLSAAQKKVPGAKFTFWLRGNVKPERGGKVSVEITCTNTKVELLEVAVPSTIEENLKACGLV